VNTARLARPFTDFERVSTIATFVVITAVGWFTVPGPRWALVTLGASGTLLVISLTTATLPVPSRARIALVIGASVSHVIAFNVSLNVPPIITVGDPPGRMLTSVSLQSASHAIRYRLPLPQPTSSRMRVKLVLARAYEGPAHLLIDVSGRSNGTMTPPGGNSGEREFTFDMAQLSTENTVVVTITPDLPDQNLRIAAWRSGLGRMLSDEPEYLVGGMVFLGLPDPMTGRMIQAWPMIWVTGP
jgi:hypothetical protein